MGYWDALKEAISLLKDLSILEKVASKLVNNPDVAAEKLAVALSELGKSYKALDGALINLATLSFKNQDDSDESRRYLLEAQGGKIDAEIGAAMGHCHKIWNNYERYLRGWFSRVLNQNEASELETLFKSLRGMDSIFVDANEALSKEAQNTADNLLNPVDDGKLDEAKTEVKQLAKEFREPGKTLSEGMVKLWKMQADFIVLSGAV